MIQQHDSSSLSGVRTDEKKQHFDDIYMAETPVPFKERIIDALDYVSDNYNRAVFDRLIHPKVASHSSESNPLKVVDLCSCFGNTTLATLHGMSVDDIRKNWKDESSCFEPLKPRQLPAHVTAIDISQNAVDYGKKAGIFDETICVDLNQPSEAQLEKVKQAMSEADVIISTASLVYLEIPTIEMLFQSFSKGLSKGYALVNFLNPFSLEKSDATKRLLIDHLQFVGSTATRHRRLSALERENYPEEEWALLELWVMGRK